MENKETFTKEIMQELVEVENLGIKNEEVILMGLTEAFGDFFTLACC